MVLLKELNSHSNVFFFFKRSFRQYIAEWDSSTAGGMPCLIKACMTLEVLFTDGSRRLRCCFRDLGKSTLQGTLYQGLAWKCSLLSHVQLFCNMMDCSPPGSSVHEIFQARILDWVAIPFSRWSFLARIQTRIFCIASRFFTVWATRKAYRLAWKWSESQLVVSDSLQLRGLYSPWNSPSQNTGVGSLSLFQGIFPSQGLNPGFPQCRRILYPLSHKGSIVYRN